MGLLNQIGASWINILGEEFEKEYMQKMAAWLSHQRVNGSREVYPASEDVFRAFRLCDSDRVKVVILGQEPYYQGNADGLAFSYKNGIRMGQGMQALDVILAEIERNCYEGFNVNSDYQLDYLAEQGVLLLNVVLTVFKGQVGSHKDIGWQRFTSKALQYLILDQRPKVFLLWGNEAKQTFVDAVNQAIADGRYVNISNIHGIDPHLILRSYHPAYDLHKRDSVGQIVARYPDGFTGCGHFSAANRFLLAKNIGAIDWLPIEKNTGVEPLSDQIPF